MGDSGRSRTPRGRASWSARLVAVAVGGSLLVGACGSSSAGLGEANGGSGVAGDAATPTASESAAPAAALHDSGDERSDASVPRTTTRTDAGATAAGGGSEADRGRRDEAADAKAARRSASAGRVPGLDGDDPFHRTLAAYWTLLHGARQEPWSYDEAELDEVAVGAGRERFLQRVDNLGAAESIIARDDSRFEVRLSGMRIGTEVAVGEECVLDDLVHVVVRDARTFERYDPPLVTDDRVFTNRYGVTFQLVDGTWKVAERVLIEGREGVSGCARDW